ncbi:tRNA (adenosine(37)-N6)-threonylcarbamoyltransferase complex ATPase subunit type 1 TsaE [Desulfoplanes sp.]
MMDITLGSLADTSRFAQKLAACIQGLETFPAILFQGDLGSGKTTLTGMLVPLLPGGEGAEVSSPSFTVMNVYPTRPETAHFDFYRMEGMGLDGTMEEYLYDPTRLCIAEWIEHLPDQLWPDEYLLIGWSVRGSSRDLSLTAQGPMGAKMLACLIRD